MVKIPDVAFVTFQAFLMYLYTYVIEFAPFGSKLNRWSRHTEISQSPEDKVPRPSPKSIYRLADKYDVPALKALAVDQIRRGLAGCEIVKETFCRFISQYDELKSIYSQQLAYTLAEHPSEGFLTNMGGKIESFIKGDIGHATEVVSALWVVLNSDEVIKTPNTPPLATQGKSPSNWGAVRLALVKSIRTGIFFDRKYWARRSSNGDVLVPIYFSSTVMNNKAPQLNNLVKYLIDSSALVNYLEKIGVDSGWERDPRGTDGETRDVIRGEGGEIRAIFIVGSFSTHTRPCLSPSNCKM